jgi:hypothetical protein
MCFRLLANPPYGQAYVKGSNDGSQSFRLTVKRLMTEDSADEGGRFILADFEIHDAVSGVAQVKLVESTIQGEKGWTVQLPEEWDNLIVIHTASAYIVTNLPNGNAPPPEEQALTFWKMLVQHYHAGTDSMA